MVVGSRLGKVELGRVKRRLLTAVTTLALAAGLAVATTSVSHAAVSDGACGYSVSEPGETG